MTEIIVIFALTLITLSAIFLDIIKKLNLLHKILMYIYFIFAPHIVALGYFLIQHSKFGQDNAIYRWAILTEIIIFILYIFIKVNIIPNNKKQIVNFRLRIMLGGRCLVLYGLYTAFVQIIIYLIGNTMMQRLAIPEHILVIDSIIVMLNIIILIINGMLRILCIYVANWFLHSDA